LKKQNKSLQTSELKRGSRIRKKKRFFDYTGDADYSFTFESPDVHFKIQVIFPTMELLLPELRGLSEGTAEVSKLFSHILCPPDDVD
jgi:hypothetical protein